MKKQTTQKEFKELIIEVYGNYDLDRIINTLIIQEYYHEKELKNFNLMIASKSSKEKADKMFDFLNAKGYYNI